MKNEERTLNNDPNDIAGNSPNGPAGNTAARPEPVATSTSGGSPTQLPTPASGGGAGTSVGNGKSAASSESLVDSEMSVGQGGIGRTVPRQENKEADPATIKEPARRGRKPGSSNKAKEAPQSSTDAKAQGRKKGGAPGSQPDQYGGNFGNDMHGSFQDASRRHNQDSAPDRGEFGAQGRQGATHGGFGNQYREADYDRHNSAEDRYYGGPGRYGPQHNAYREYDGHNERYDSRRHYHFEPGYHPDQHGRRDYDRPHFSDGYGQAYYNDREHQSGNYNDGRGNRYDNRNQPDRADQYSNRQNDNGSRQGRGGGYADDYGHTSVGRNPYGEPRRYNDDYDQRGQGRGYEGGPRRNQDEDYRSSRGGYDNQGSSGGRGGQREDDYGPRPQSNDQRGQRPADSRGYSDRGRDEPSRRPDYRTGDDRNGYGRSYSGSSDQGYGSRGGSYNDAYDDSRRDSRTGSPAQGDYRREDGDRNYGQGQRPNHRNAHDEPDYGTSPRRNKGRDTED